MHSSYAESHNRVCFLVAIGQELLLRSNPINALDLILDRNDTTVLVGPLLQKVEMYTFLGLDYF